MENDFVYNYLDEHGPEMVKVLISTHLEAIQELQGENQEKINYHVEAIRNIMQQADKIYPRLKITPSNTYMNTDVA